MRKHVMLYKTERKLVIWAEIIAIIVLVVFEPELEELLTKDFYWLIEWVSKLRDIKFSTIFSRWLWSINAESGNLLVTTNLSTTWASSKKHRLFIWWIFGSNFKPLFSLQIIQLKQLVEIGLQNSEQIIAGLI